MSEHATLVDASAGQRTESAQTRENKSCSIAIVKFPYYDAAASEGHLDLLLILKHFNNNSFCVQPAAPNHVLVHPAVMTAHLLLVRGEERGPGCGRITSYLRNRACVELMSNCARRPFC